MSDVYCVGNLTDKDFQGVEGNAGYLAGKSQERYGWDRDRAHIEVTEFARSIRSGRNN